MNIRCPPRIVGWHTEQARARLRDSCSTLPMAAAGRFRHWERGAGIPRDPEQMVGGRDSGLLGAGVSRHISRTGGGTCLQQEGRRGLNGQIRRPPFNEENSRSIGVDMPLEHPLLLFIGPMNRSSGCSSVNNMNMNSGVNINKNIV